MCAAELSWIAPAGNTGDLRGGERHYFELRIVAKANIEIVKIPPRRAHE